MKSAQRIERLRELMKKEAIDVVLCDNVSDLIWLTGFEHVFDFESAHLALITQDACLIHTDTRYSAAMRTKAAEEGMFIVSDKPIAHSIFVEEELKKNNLLFGTVAVNSQVALSTFREYEKLLPHAILYERQDDIKNLRATKDQNEIVAIKAAQEISETAFLKTLKNVQAGKTEKELAIELEFTMRALGADGVSFNSIIAAGSNGAKPHAQPSERKIKQGDLIVFDFGVLLNGYCSDTTRMVCMGKPSSEQQRAYDAVRCANEEVRAAIKPGVSGYDMHMLAEQVLEEHGFGGKMGHGLGHGVGIDIHELPMLNKKNMKPLEEGSIVTIEPGVYLEGKFGIRLEDFGCVSASSFDNFCSLTHDLIIVE